MLCYSLRRLNASGDRSKRRVHDSPLSWSLTVVVEDPSEFSSADVSSTRRAATSAIRVVVGAAETDIVVRRKQVKSSVPPYITAAAYSDGEISFFHT